MRRPGRAIATLALLCGLAAPALATAAPNRGEIGGPPTKKSLGKARFGGKPLSKPTVIAVGPTAFGPVELVAQKRKDGLCIFTFYLKSNSLGSSSCRGSIYPPFEGSIEASGWTWFGEGGDVEGTVTGEVDSVSLRLEENGRARTVPALLAKTDPSILQRLRVKPFTYFFGTYRGCYPPHKIVAEAHDAAGAVIGRSRGFKPPKGFGNPCASRKKR